MKTIFDTLPNMDEFFIGAGDQLTRMLDRFDSINTMNGASHYPPYNIVVDKETNEGRVYTIQLAVAGFRMEDLEVSLDESETMPTLTVEGSTKPSNDTVQIGDTLVSKFQYRGIAARQFVRRFVLERGSKVTDVTLRDGLLNITLLNPSEYGRNGVKKLKINTSVSAPAKKQLLNEKA